MHYESNMFIPVNDFMQKPRSRKKAKKETNKQKDKVNKMKNLVQLKGNQLCNVTVPTQIKCYKNVDF